MIKIEYVNEFEDVYDLTVDQNHNFYGNDILVHNCMEITLPTVPIKSFEDDTGEIALCTLSAINLGVLDLENLHHEMKTLSDLAVRALDELISVQEYPLPAAKISTINRRSLGIGYIGLAHFLAKNKINYNSQEAIDLVDRVTESLQYHCILASINLAKEEGPCGWYDRTKYSKGILPIDTYTKKLDEVCSRPLELDWEALRVELKQHGIRNSTLTAQMPSESSSVVSNETNGIECPRDVVQRKKSKIGILKMLIPEYKKYKEYYNLTWDSHYSNKYYLSIAGVIQKYFDQAISVNEYYNPFEYPNGEIPVKDIMNNLLFAYSIGIKTTYYLNVYDGKEEQEDVPENCASGACAI